jgi:soluble lytic murein transglycosylase
MRWNIKKRLALVIAFAALASMVWYFSDGIEKWLYPIKYQAEINQAAEKNELDELLVAAVIRAESDFKPHLVSEKGAIGLMQIMPDTAEWAADQMRVELPSIAQLEEPQLNIEIGTWYLKSLHQQFENNHIVAIAAYNAGPTNVRKWLQDGTWDGSLEQLLQIPFGETRHYVKRVDRFYEKYVELYRLNDGS